MPHQFHFFFLKTEFTSDNEWTGCTKHYSVTARLTATYSLTNLDPWVIHVWTATHGLTDLVSLLIHVWMEVDTLTDLVPWVIHVWTVTPWPHWSCSIGDICMNGRRRTYWSCSLGDTCMNGNPWPHWSCSIGNTSMNGSRCTYWYCSLDDTCLIMHFRWWHAAGEPCATTLDGVLRIQSHQM